MAILNFGTGSWGLPELGITEALGGKSKSVYNAAVKSGIQSTPTNTTSGGRYGPFVPNSFQTGEVKGVTTTRTSNNSSSQNSSNSNKSSSSKSSSSNEDSGPSEQDIINEEYKNYVNVLGGLASNAQSQAGTAKTQLQNEYDTGLQTFDNQLATGQQDLTNRKVEVGQNAQLGNVRIKQALDQLRQRDIARLSNMGAFGSSTADATAERYGRTALSQIGELENTKQSALASIDNETTKLNDFYNSKKSELKLSYQRGINDIESQLQNRLGQIDQLKGEAANRKAEATLQAWRDYTNNVNSFKSQIFSYANQLEQWAVTQGNTLQQARDYAIGATQGLNPSNFGIISPTQSYKTSTDNSMLPNTLPSTVAGVRLTNLGNNNEDQNYIDLLNGSYPSTVMN